MSIKMVVWGGGFGAFLGGGGVPILFLWARGFCFLIIRSVPFKAARKQCSFSACTKG